MMWFEFNFRSSLEATLLVIWARAAASHTSHSAGRIGCFVTLAESLKGCSKDQVNRNKNSFETQSHISYVVSRVRWQDSSIIGEHLSKGFSGYDPTMFAIADHQHSSTKNRNMCWKVFAPRIHDARNILTLQERFFGDGFLMLLWNVSEDHGCSCGIVLGRCALLAPRRKEDSGSRFEIDSHNMDLFWISPTFKKS